MARRIRADKYRHKIKFYESQNVYNPTTGIYNKEWVYAFSLWCNEKVIFREQLEAVVVGGSNTLRDRREFTTRFTDKVDTTQRCEFKGHMYDITIVGDKRGDLKEIAFLGESIKDGGH